MLQKILPNKLSLAFTILKQFGTGIIISTAFVHVRPPTQPPITSSLHANATQLYTHASLMFANECLGELEYEATTSAILIAGLFLSFVVEFTGERIVLAKSRAATSQSRAEQSKALLSTEVVSILVMEAGILFHSLRKYLHL